MQQQPQPSPDVDYGLTGMPDNSVRAEEDKNGPPPPKKPASPESQRPMSPPPSPKPR